jgi:Cu(I)/Ag(I) efflux system membrane fusion protein
MMMKRIALSVSPLAFLVLAALPANAAETKSMPEMKMDTGSSAQGQVHKGQGSVNRIDEKAGKVNLIHGPIATLKWPGMAMDFAVSDKQVLAGLKPGQKVEFKLVEKTKGQYVITEITPGK